MASQGARGFPVRRGQIPGWGKSQIPRRNCQQQVTFTRNLASLLSTLKGLFLKRPEFYAFCLLAVVKLS